MGHRGRRCGVARRRRPRASARRRSALLRQGRLSQWTFRGLGRSGSRTRSGPLSPSAIMALFFTGDTHFGDMRVLRFDRRPFATLEAHDAGLIERWNAVVTRTDTVWHLGDFALG